VCGKSKEEEKKRKTRRREKREEKRKEKENSLLGSHLKDFLLSSFPPKLGGKKFVNHNEIESFSFYFLSFTSIPLNQIIDLI
jgi:hypothetical protein